MRFKSRSRALAASALAASLGLSGLALTASPVNAEPAEIIRVAGATRYGTAAAAADRAYPDGATNVVLASGEAFPDALSAGGFAGSLDAPILLTPSDRLDDATIAGLENLGAENVYVMGGTAAVSETVVDALEEEGYTVERIAGADRFETAALTAEEIGGTTRVLANGFSFADALAISPGAHSLELPILLTGADELNEDAAAGLEDATTVVIVGGTAVVSQEIEDELEADGKTVVRLAGATRYESAVEIAEFHFDNGFDDDELVMATGENFADALAGGPLASQLNAPLVLTQTNVLTPATEAFIESIAPALDTLYILGGTAAITDAVANAAAAAADEDADGNQSFSVTPAGAQTNTADGNAAADNVVFTVTGITTSTVDLALVPCAAVTEGANGLVTFADAENTDADAELEGNNQADAIDADDTDTPAGFVSVNGAPAGGVEYVNDAAVVNNAVQFAIDSAEPTCVRAVIFDDADDDNALDLDAQNRPTEAFSVTGPVTFTAPAATTGRIGNTTGDAFDEGVDVVSNDEAANTFVGCDIEGANTGTADEAVDAAECNNFAYDANDRFFIGGTANANQATLEQFELALSTGDDVEGDYNANPALQSVFILTDEAPLAPGSATAAPTPRAENTSVTITFADSASSGVDSYNVYRAVDSTPADPCPTFRGAGNAINTAAYALVTNVPDTRTTGNYTVVDSSRSASTKYCYAVTAVDQGDESDDQAETTATTAAAATQDTLGPQSDDTELTTNGGFQDELDAGDVITICFNEALRAPDAGDALLIDDDDDDVARLTNGQNATFALGTAASTAVETAAGADCPANQTLVVTLTGAPADTNPATGDNRVDLVAYIVDSAGVTDVAGNRWDINNSDDTEIDEEQGEAIDADFTDQATDSDAIFGDDNGDVVTITFADPVTFDPNNESVSLVQNDYENSSHYDCGFEVTCAGTGTTTMVITVVDEANATDLTFDGVGLDFVDHFDGMLDSVDGLPEPIDAPAPA